MKLYECGPVLAAWQYFDNTQRKRVVEYFEGYLCKDFGRLMHWGNECHNPRPSGLKGRARFSSLTDFSKDAIGYYPDTMMHGLVAISACRSPLRFHNVHVEEIPAEEPKFPGLDGRMYHDVESLENADRKFLDLMRPVFEFAAKSRGISMKEAEDILRPAAGAKEYVLVHGCERLSGFTDEKMAVEEAMRVTRMMFNGHFAHLDFPAELERTGYRSDCMVEIPKLDYIKSRIQFSDLWHLTDDLPFYGKLVNGDENTEFIKLLESI